MTAKGKITRKILKDNRLSFCLNGQEWVSLFDNEENKALFPIVDVLKEGQFVEFEVIQNAKGFKNIVNIVPYTTTPKKEHPPETGQEKPFVTPKKEKEKKGDIEDWEIRQRLIVAQSTLSSAVAAVAAIDKMDMSQEEQLQLIKKLWGEYFMGVFDKSKEDF